MLVSNSMEAHPRQGSSLAGCLAGLHTGHSVENVVRDTDTGVFPIMDASTSKFWGHPPGLAHCPKAVFNVTPANASHRLPHHHGLTPAHTVLRCNTKPSQADPCLKLCVSNRL